MSVHLRAIQSPTVQEFYITALSEAPQPAAQQAQALYGAVAAALRERGARLLQERVFGTPAAIEAALPVRAQAYGALDDGVPPALLAVPQGPTGELAGVLVHAVSGAAPRALTPAGQPCGRALAVAGRQYVLLSGLTGPSAGDAPRQARAVFEHAEAALRQAGTDMKSVVRTWLWLGDILSWYGPFNAVRTRFYTERGLLNGTAESHMPASTGIGVRPSRAGEVALDVIALTGEGVAVEYLSAAGRQRSPYEYGSAFSRAARAPMPAGPAVFVSGTAAIDTQGRSLFDGDAQAQIDITLQNVRAVLGQMGCGDQDVVQAIAYSKTPAVEAVFRSRFGALSWPCVSVVADICRPELLFEVEVTAAPGAKGIGIRL